MTDDSSPAADEQEPAYRGGCVKGMPLTGACHRGCLHRTMATEYRDWRHSWEERRANGENMQLEDDDYRAKYPAPTFKAWLQGQGR